MIVLDFSVVIEMLLQSRNGLEIQKRVLDRTEVCHAHTPFPYRIWELRSNLTAHGAAYIALAGLALASCVQYETVEAPPEIRLAALSEAKNYIGMEYEYGGQDFYEKGIDCSGLVVNCYKTTIENTDYRLLFTDASVRDLLDRYTTEISDPTPGDVIFMGDDEVTHVAVFSYRIDSELHFIDANSVTGVVEERFYQADNRKIKMFGRLLLLRKHGM